MSNPDHIFRSREDIFREWEEQSYQLELKFDQMEVRQERLVEQIAEQVKKISNRLDARQTYLNLGFLGTAAISIFLVGMVMQDLGMFRNQ